jgi:hypothetical protein
MRITKEQMRNIFKLLLKEMGKSKDVGNYDGWDLDYAACYGGYMVVQYGPMGSQSLPFGIKRRGAQEMYSAMEMTVRALQLKQEEQRTK